MRPNPKEAAQRARAKLTREAPARAHTRERPPGQKDAGGHARGAAFGSDGIGGPEPPGLQLRRRSARSPNLRQVPTSRCARRHTGTAAIAHRGYTAAQCRIYRALRETNYRRSGCCSARCACFRTRQRWSTAHFAGPTAGSVKRWPGSRARCSARASSPATASRSSRRTCPSCSSRTSRCCACARRSWRSTRASTRRRSATSSTTPARSIVFCDPELAPRVAGRGGLAPRRRVRQRRGRGGRRHRAPARRAELRRVRRAARRCCPIDERGRRRGARHLDQLHLGHHRSAEGRHVHAPRRVR